MVNGAYTILHQYINIRQKVHGVMICRVLGTELLPVAAPAFAPAPTSYEAVVLVRAARQPLQSRVCVNVSPNGLGWLAIGFAQ